MRSLFTQQLRQRGGTDSQPTAGEEMPASHLQRKLAMGAVHQDRFSILK
jgi:hypothetical protein